MYIAPSVPNTFFADEAASDESLELLEADSWLMNTEVRYHLQEKRSQWHLTMVFVAVDNPMKFICRKIDVYPSEQKALTFARILQRGIRKDARGTLKMNKDAFNICTN